MTDRSAPGTKDLAWLWEAQGKAPLTRKRIKKLATQVSEEAIAAYLGVSLDGPNDPYLYVMEWPIGPYVEQFLPDGRVMDWMDDTPEVLRIAMADFLRRRGYPVFRTHAEAKAYAAQRSWPAPERGPPVKD
jgi:hypothetical protein